MTAVHPSKLFINLLGKKFKHKQKQRNNNNPPPGLHYPASTINKLYSIFLSLYTKLTPLFPDHFEANPKHIGTSKNNQNVSQGPDRIPFPSNITVVPVSQLKKRRQVLIQNIHSEVQFLIKFDSGSKKDPYNLSTCLSFF